MKMPTCPCCGKKTSSALLLKKGERGYYGETIYTSGCHNYLHCDFAKKSRFEGSGKTRIEAIKNYISNCHSVRQGGAE